MEITDIKLFHTKPGSKIKANGFLTFDKALKVKFMLMEGTNGLFVTYPAEKYTAKDGTEKWSKFVEVFDKELTASVNQSVMAAFQGNVENQGVSQEPESQVVKPAPVVTKKNLPPF